MGYFIGIAFWILLSGCLLTKSLPIPMPEDFRVIAELKNVTCRSDSTFYAPTNVQPQCITTALDCVYRELEGRAKVECENSDEYINDALEILDCRIEKRKTRGHALTDSRDCACERWPETSLSDFATAVMKLFEQENSLQNMQ